MYTVQLFTFNIVNLQITSSPTVLLISVLFHVNLTFCTEPDTPLLTESVTSNKKTRKNIRKIDKTLMTSDDMIFKVNETISKHENSTKNQSEIDRKYNDVLDILPSEIDKLPNVPNPQSKKREGRS